MYANLMRLRPGATTRATTYKRWFTPPLAAALVGLLLRARRKGRTVTISACSTSGLVKKNGPEKEPAERRCRVSSDLRSSAVALAMPHKQYRDNEISCTRTVAMNVLVAHVLVEKFLAGAGATLRLAEHLP